MNTSFRHSVKHCTCIWIFVYFSSVNQYVLYVIKNVSRIVTWMTEKVFYYHYYKAKQSHCMRFLVPCACLSTVALGMVLTSGCATSRHCHTEELPGVKIHCCDSDLCNCAPHHHKLLLSSHTLHLIIASFATVWLQLWKARKKKNVGARRMKNETCAKISDGF